MSDAGDIRVVAAEPAHGAGLAALFDAASSPCFCRWWHFEGDKNAWLERCALRPDESRAELRAALDARTDEARGVVALAGEELVGWLKVAPAAAAQKLYAQRLYKGLPCFASERAGVFVVGCALVHPSHRHKGVATALVAGAARVAPLWGAKALEAFPRRPKEPVADEELWTGPHGAYAKAGFVEVNAFEPYPVLRREL